MGISPLTALSPLDGRYADQAAPLRAWFSELALIRARVRVEAAWLARLAEEPGLGPEPEADALACLEAAAKSFSEADALAVKEIERTTNHDVKAVEYFLRERLAGWPRLAGFTHFACTSEDVNNLAWGVLLHGARREVLLPAIDSLAASLRALAHRYADAQAHVNSHSDIHPNADA